MPEITHNGKKPADAGDKIEEYCCRHSVVPGSSSRLRSPIDGAAPRLGDNANPPSEMLYQAKQSC
jgi:hypothetical protein